jgi:hypothetical protein
LAPTFRQQGAILLAIDGLQPAVGHEVLWVLRDCLSGAILLARSLRSSTQGDLAALIAEALEEIPVPVRGVITDGQHSVRKAVAKALPKVPHQLCHFHYPREAGRPIDELDRAAKKDLQQTVRGVRALERTVEGTDDALAEVVRGSCGAVRSAVTDDGRPPLDASGLVLEERLSAIAASLDRVAEQGGHRPESAGYAPCWPRDWKRRRSGGRWCAQASVTATKRHGSWPTPRGLRARKFGSTSAACSGAFAPRRRRPAPRSRPS